MYIILKNWAICIRYYIGVRVKASESFLYFLNNCFIINELSKKKIHKISTWDHLKSKELQK